MNNRDINILDENSNDKIVKSIKLGSQLIPLPGASFIAELITDVIPNQKGERIDIFLKKLDNDLSNLEEEFAFLEGFLINPYFLDMFEETLVKASRSITEIRMDYLSKLLIKSFNQSDIELIQSKYLLNLLNELNDIEILILSSFGPNSNHSTQNLDNNKPSPRNDSYIKDKAIYDSYTNHLIRIGLLKQQSERVSERVSKEQKIITRISDLGIIFLNYIGVK